jgi:hypothetical protein
MLWGLQQDEIKEWADFCTSSFAYKPHLPPAEYLYRCFMNDPCHGPTLLICVAVWNDDTLHKQIVWSCRMFLKKVSMSGVRFSKAGSIREVCTNPVY